MPDDIYSILMGSEPDAAESARAMAEAIRRQRASGLATTLADRRDPIGAFGAAQQNYAKQDEGLLERAGAARLHYAPQMDAMREKQAMLADPATADVLTHVGQAFDRESAGPNFGQAKNSAKLALLPLLEKSGLAKANLSFKEMMAQSASAAKKDKTDAGEYDKAQQDLVKFAKEIDAAKQARSALGVSAQNVYRAQAALPLLQGKMIPPQFLHDVAINLARIAGSGGNIGEEMAKRLEAKGLKADAARIESYLTSHPVDTDMKAWVDLLKTKMQQEEQVADTFQRHSAVKQLSAQSRAAKYAAPDLKRVIDAAGLTDYVQDDLLTPVAPGNHAGVVSRSALEKAKAKAPPGSRVAFDPDGRAAVLAPGEQVPSGWWEAK